MNHHPSHPLQYTSIPLDPNEALEDGLVPVAPTLRRWTLSSLDIERIPTSLPWHALHKRTWTKERENGVRHPRRHLGRWIPKDLTTGGWCDDHHGVE